MYVVSGCPRSGTSLMMGILREVFGDDRILGTKFPFEDKYIASLKKQKAETEKQYEYRLFTNNILNPNTSKEIETSKDMNPCGFWECEFTVNGIKWDIKNCDYIENTKNKICKIVSQGLANSDPKYINKIIYMLRDPKSVAKSQERLKRKLSINGEDIYENNTVHTPLMFINVTVQAAKWLNKFKHIPVIFVKYDELLDNSHTVLKNIEEFLQDGDFSESHNIINQKLKRSKPEDIDNELWEDASIIYEAFCDKDFDFIEKYISNPDININRQARKWMCLRTKTKMVEKHCLECKSSSKFRNNLKSHAIDNKIDWLNMPCAFECAFDVDNDLISIDESISNNFWV